jgi:hypothetical protein
MRERVKADKRLNRSCVDTSKKAAFVNTEAVTTPGGLDSWLALDSSIRQLNETHPELVMNVDWEERAKAQVAIKAALEDKEVVEKRGVVFNA